MSFIKSLVKWSGMIALTTAPLVSHQMIVSDQIIYAAQTVNFDQGNLSNEAFVKRVLQDFSKLDRVEMVATMEGAKKGQENIYRFDRPNNATYTEEYNFMTNSRTAYYIYQDGIMVRDLIGELKAAEPQLGKGKPDFANKVKELEKKVKSKWIALPKNEKMTGKEKIETPLETFLTKGVKFEKYQKKGDVVSVDVNFDSVKDKPFFVSFVQADPLATNIDIKLVVDPKDQSVNMKMKVDHVLPASESGQKPQVGPTLNTDTVFKATDKALKTRDQLKPIEFAEFEKVMKETGVAEYLKAE
ncbi:hypothetical protein [Vaginisenegalia massiliensis]|uniref:hypothetical protein n=1 Tax=Vaginisenegalia massiliensis TaxID=2058294 RepID=UPI000F52B274|nr:hypothetical protein [Vaginisenegalia massiliensis]